MYIISGSMSVLQHSTNFQGATKKNDAEVHSHSSYPGDVIGGLAVLTGESSLYTVRAKQFSRVALLTRTSVYK